MVFLTNFIMQDEGVTAIEYAVVAGLIALVIIAGVTAIGAKLKPIYSSAASGI